MAQRSDKPVKKAKSAPERRPTRAGSADDVALVWGRSEDGETLGVLRKRGDEVQPALMKRAREGQPIHGELLQLSPREEPHLYDVKVLHDGRADASDQAGPAKVANHAYRKGWDRLFKKRSRSTLN